MMIYLMRSTMKLLKSLVYSMHILIDTHIALWFLDGSPALPPRARELVENPNSKVFISDVSVWEIAIKHAKRPDIMPRSCSDFVDLCDRVGFAALPLSRNAITTYERLDTSKAEGIHKDPLDRMLIAQAKTENTILLTHDKSLALYDEPLVCVI